MATAVREVQPQSLHTATITSGGILWRRGASGSVEVCLAHSTSTFGDSFAIPRGAVHEDERVADAAVRRVYEQTGLGGRAPRPLGRLSFATGEIAYLHLLRAPRGASTPKNASWVPVASAPRLVETDGEREVLTRIAAIFAEPRVEVCETASERSISAATRPSLRASAFVA